MSQTEYQPETETPKTGAPRKPPSISKRQNRLREQWRQASKKYYNKNKDEYNRTHNPLRKCRLCGKTAINETEATQFVKNTHNPNLCKTCAAQQMRNYRRKIE